MVGSPRCLPNDYSILSLYHTYAAALYQPGAETFWVPTTFYNYNAYDADATHAFGEAISPTSPLYVIIDTQYIEWWEKVKCRPQILNGCVLTVQHVLQEHI